jgi:hypothetical protein
MQKWGSSTALLVSASRFAVDHAEVGRGVPLRRSVVVMSADPGPPRPDREQPQARPVPTGAAHLDEDPEALEDPVHSGDARHQHELHEKSAAEEA